MKRISATLLALLCSTTFTLASELRVGLQDDVDLMDPDRSRAFVGKIMFTSMCDTLIDIDASLNFVPRLATSWKWSDDGMTLTLEIREGAIFQDGTPIDAEAVKANFERSMTLEGSLRRSELASVGSVDVAGPHTVVLKLKAPDSSLISQLTGQPGMMKSPTAFKAGDFAQNPVCSGPYRFVSRVQNDQITFEKFDGYWNAKAYSFDKVVFRPVPDTTVRLANLRSGDLDLIERIAPSDFDTIKSDGKTKLETAAGLGFQGFMINLKKDNPVAKDARVRQALSLSIDRDIINEVVGGGTYLPATQPFAPSSFAHEKRFDHKRDVEKAKALLKEAGYERVKLEIMFGNNTLSQQVYEMIQAMAAEAGFDITLKPTEFAALQAAMREHNFEAAQAGWAGRIDPDGNIAHYVTCAGSLNDSGYCNKTVDELLKSARGHTDEAARKADYDKFQEIIAADLPQIFLYFTPWPYGVSSRIEGFTAYPDGIIRLAGVKKAN